MPILRTCPSEAVAAVNALPLTAAQKEHALFIIRNSPARSPSARTGKRYYYQSKKTGQMWQLEGGVAWATARDLDRNPSVKWWVSEAPRITVQGERVENEGKENEAKIPENEGHFPDFFVVYSTHAGYLEAKAEGALNKLQSAKPWRYERNTLGKMTSQAAERVAKSQGFNYEIVTENAWSHVRQRNLDNLLPLAGPLTATDHTIADFIKTHEGCHINGLELKLKVSRADIRAAIANDAVYVDLDQVDIAYATAMFRIYSSADQKALLDTIETSIKPPANLGVTRLPNYEAGEILLLDNERYDVTFTHGTIVGVKQPDGRIQTLDRAYIEAQLFAGRGAFVGKGSEEVQDLLQKAMANCDAINIAKTRHKRIQGFLDQQPKDGGRARYVGRKPNRTEQLWIKKFWEAHHACGMGFLGLVPATANRGPKGRQLNDEKEEIIAVFIVLCYSHPDAPSMSLTYGDYLLYLDEQKKPHLKVSRATFDARKRDYKKAKLASDRGGDGLVALVEPPYPWVLYRTPRHGTYPYQIVHIDHSPLDIETIDPTTGKAMGKPWLTIMFDGATRMVLAHYLSYQAPSYASVYAVMRIYMQHHEYKPVMLVLDNGPDFVCESTALLIYALGINVQFRPVRRPKFGSIIERFFGSCEACVFHNLPGNSKLEAQGIYIDAAHDPAKRAIFTLEQVDTIFADYAYGFYADQDHPALFTSPRSAFQKGLNEYSSRLPKLPNHFLTRILMLPIPKRSRGMAKVQAKLGVQIGYYRYYCGVFDDSSLDGKYVPVRYDPLDRVIAYAWVRGKWYLCKCRELESLMALPGVTLQCVSTAVAHLRSKHATGYNARCEDLAKFLRGHVTDKGFCLENARCEATRLLFAKRVGRIEVHDAALGDEVVEQGAPPPPTVPPGFRFSKPGLGESGVRVGDPVEAEIVTPDDAGFEDDITPKP